GGQVLPAPACYPPPEHSFAGYPSAWLSDAASIRSTEGGKAELEILLRMPLTSHAPESRCRDIVVLRKVMDAAAGGCALADLDRVFAEAGVQRGAGRAAVAWLLKYGLLEVSAAVG